MRISEDYDLPFPRISVTAASGRRRGGGGLDWSRCGWWGCNCNMCVRCDICELSRSKLSKICDSDSGFTTVSRRFRQLI
jgi:hypothetical protein